MVRRAVVRFQRPAVRGFALGFDFVVGGRHHHRIEAKPALEVDDVLAADTVAVEVWRRVVEDMENPHH
jgi:hypothetical protein